MKKNNKRYFTAEEIKTMVLNEKKLPHTTNQSGEKETFIAKVRGSIFGEGSGGKRIFK